MRRIYVLMPTAESCKRVVDELKTLGLPEHHLHVVAGLTQNLEGLPEATVWQKTELAHGLEWGIAMGGLAGLIGSGLAIVFPPPGLVLGHDALLLATAAGAVLGGLMSATIASHEHNHSLDRFRQEISLGRLLLMVDVPGRQMSEIQSLIRRHFPEAMIEVRGSK